MSEECVSMAERVESPQVLLEMLDMLCSLQGCVSYADVCVCLSRRFALPALCELRSLLYSTACRDPCFPATLFRGRLHPAATSSLSAAADVVSLFNLITITRPPFYTLPLPSDSQSLAFSPATLGYAGHDWPAGVPAGAEGGAVAPEGKYEAGAEAAVSPGAQVPTFTHPHTHRPSMQDVHSDFAAGSVVMEPPAANESAGLDRVTAKRNVFKADFHNVPPLDATEPAQQLGSTESVDRPMKGRNEDILFLSLKNPYPDPTVQARAHSPQTHTYAEVRRVKHESVDGVDGSSYFGPSARDWPPPGHTLPHKSHSLEDGTRERSPGELRDYELKGSLSVESGVGGAGVGQTGLPEFLSVGTAYRHSGPIGSNLGDSGAIGSSLGGSGSIGSDQVLSGLTGSGLSISTPTESSTGGLAPVGSRLGGSGPIGMQTSGFEEVRAALKRLSGRSLDLIAQDWPPGAEGVSSVSTQTDAASRLRSLNKLSIDNSDIGEDDISAIFRFLDDISMCGSVAALVPEGAGAGAEAGGTPSSPDRRARLGKLKRLFHSLEAPEEVGFGAGLGAGLGRLLVRVSEVEKRLEPLGDLRDTLTHILAALQRLEVQTNTLTRKHPALMEPQPIKSNPAIREGRSVGTATTMATTTAAKRRGVVTRRDMTESSSTWSVSYSKEQHTHTTQVWTHTNTFTHTIHKYGQGVECIHTFPRIHTIVWSYTQKYTQKYIFIQRHMTQKLKYGCIHTHTHLNTLAQLTGIYTLSYTLTHITRPRNHTYTHTHTLLR